MFRLKRKLCTSWCVYPAAWMRRSFVAMCRSTCSHQHSQSPAYRRTGKHSRKGKTKRVWIGCCLRCDGVIVEQISIFQSISQVRQSKKHHVVSMLRVFSSVAILVEISCASPQKLLFIFIIKIYIERIQKIINVLLKKTSGVQVVYVVPARWRRLVLKSIQTRPFLALRLNT